MTVRFQKSKQLAWQKTRTARRIVSDRARAVRSKKDELSQLLCNCLLWSLFGSLSAARTAALFCTALARFFFILSADEFDYGHLRRIAVPDADFYNARISTGAILETRSDGVEQFSHDRFVLDDAQSLAARVQAASLAEGDDPVDPAAQFLGFGIGGSDLFLAQ